MGMRSCGKLPAMGSAVVVALGTFVTIAAFPIRAQSQGGSPVTLPPLAANAVVTVAQECPSLTVGVAQLTNEQFEFMAANHTLLLPTLAAVQTYAKPQLGPSNGTRVLEQDLANPSSEFGTIGMAGPWDRQVVFMEIAGTDADLRRHAAALTKLAPRPDRLVLCPTALSETRRRQITNELWAKLGNGQEPRFYGTEIFTPTNGKVGIHLRADAAPLAKQLQATYGNDVVFALGNFSWPDPTKPGPGPNLAARCGNAGTAKGPKVEWKVPKAITVRSGESFTIPVTVRNPAKKPIVFTPLKAVVTSDGQRVIANRAQTVFFTASIDFLQPGESRKFQVIGGTDACASEKGFSLKPGRYSVRVVSALASQDGSYAAPPIQLVVR